MAVPSDYAGLELHLKGDAGTYQDDAATTPAASNGDVIAVWQDQSGNARHATQTTGANRPTLLSPGLNGLNAIRYTAANSQYLALPNFLTGFTYGEIFAVLKTELDPPVNSTRTGLWSLGAPSSDYYTWTDGLFYVGFGSTARKIFARTGVVIETDNWHMLHVMSKASDWRFTIDQILQHSTTTNTVGWTTTPKIGVNADTTYLDGRIAEIFIYSQERSANERVLLDEYLTSRWFNPTYRETQVFSETALMPDDPLYRTTQKWAEVAHDINSAIRDTQVWAEVAYQPLGRGCYGTFIM